MDITTWEEHVYDTTFDATYDSLLEQYKAGEVTIEQIEMNIEEHYTILGNASQEGAARFQYCSALIDAHQYALAIIKKHLLS